MYSCRKRPKGSKFFPFRVDPFSKRGKNNFNIVIYIELHPFPWKYMAYQYMWPRDTHISMFIHNLQSAPCSSKSSIENVYKSQSRITYLRRCASSEDLDQPVNPRCLIRVWAVCFQEETLYSRLSKKTHAKTLSRMGWCAGWAES